MKTQNSALSQLEAHPTRSRSPVERSIRLIAGIAAVSLALLAGAQVSRAASGVWTNDASSVWSATTNWLNGTVADGSGSIADFTLNNSSNDIVTMDASHSLGTLLFGNNAGTTTNRWTLNASGGSVLTLAGGTPTIAVSNNAVATNIAYAALPIAGTAGLTKAGNGTLVLAGANTYTGNTTVSGGTLKLTNSIVGLSSTDPVLYMSFDNVSGNTVINQGTGGAAMNGTLTGSAAIVPGGIYGNCLAIPGGAATAAYVLINSAVVPLNVSAPGNNWTVAMWIKTSTVGAAIMYQGSGGWVSGNTEFHLENGVAADPGTGTHVGGVRNSQGWESGTATINDGNWHHIVMTCSNAVKTIYVDGNVDPFTAGVNQWGGLGVGNQMRIGGVAAGADSQIALNGYLDEVYIYNYALSQAQVQSLTNTPAGPTDVASSIPATSVVSVAPSAKFDLNGATLAIPGLTGTGTVDNSFGSGTPTLIENITSGSSQFDGLITNTVGTLSLTKLGAGTLILTGTNTYNGATTVNGGTLNITGASEPGNPVATTSLMTVGSGVVNFSGTIQTNYNYNIGTTTNLTGALYQNAGYLVEAQGPSGTSFQLGSGFGAYGYYYNAAGTTNYCGELGIGGESNPSGNGQMDVYGTVTNNGWIVLTRGAGAQTAGLPQTGVLNVWPGGTLYYSGGGLVCNWGSGGAQTAVVNIMGGNTILIPGNLNEPINLNQSGNAANMGVFNLNGGSISTGFVTGGTNRTIFNFNGGTLAATENQGVMMSILAANIYGGGGTFNNNGFNATLATKLTAPAGNGENSITGFAGGAGYIAPPIVAVVPGTGDTTGIGATAIAQINPNTGAVTNVVITSPGTSYTATPTFVLTGGNPTTPATITGAAPTANSIGGMTFAGTGVTTLNGGYNYTGPTFVLGGTLAVVSSNVTPSVAGSMTLSNATLNAITGSGTTTLPLSSMTLLVSNTITISYGNLSGDPTVPAISVSGPLTSAPTNIINVAAFGLTAGQFAMIKYTGGLLSPTDFAKWGLVLPNGVTANLVNDNGNKSIDLNVVSAPSLLTWNGVNGTSWDTTTANWTNPATGTITTYQEHNNGTSIAGDIVNFDDTLTNALPNWPTNINLTGVINPFPVTVNNSVASYTIAGAGRLAGAAGSTGFNYLTKNNTGTLALLTSNSFTGNIALNGGTTIITNDSAFGASANVVTLNGSTLSVNGSTTNNSRAFVVSAATIIGVGTNAAVQLGGAISGGGALTKTGAGTLTLSGADADSGATTVNGGTLNYAGSLGSSAAAAVPIVNNAGSNAIISFSPGSTVRYNNGNLLIGNAVAGNAALYQTGGTVSGINQFQVAAITGGSYGYYSLSGGSMSMQEFDLGGFNGAAVGVFDMAGGTLNVTNWIVPSRGAGGTGILNMMGGTLKFFGPAAQFQANWNAAPASGNPGTFIMNIANSSVLASNAVLNTMSTGGAGKIGQINLLAGGLLQVTSLTPGSAVGTNILTFNGGTLKAVAANAAFISTRMGVAVYSGGGTIDNNGVSITLPVNLNQPDGSGINTNFIPSDPDAPGHGNGTGYAGAPAVTISGDGFGASGYATITNGGVTGIVITSPGTDYSTYNISLTGGGNGDASFGLYDSLPNVTPNTSGGMTFQGSGTTTLTGSNTFTGPITLNAGTLILNSANTYAGNVNINGGTLSMTTASTLNGSVTITNGAGVSMIQTGSSTFGLGNLIVGVSATANNGATLGLGITPANNSAVPLVNCGTLTFNGTNVVSIAGAIKTGPVPLIHYSGAIGGSGVANVTLALPQGATGVISNSAASSTLYAVVTSTGPGLVWSGATTNLWDISTTTNWLLAATPTTYHQPIIPGDAVTFNDSGSGSVALRTNVGPSSMVVSNNSVIYTFGGTGNLSGPGGITKLGTGLAIMSLTNNNYVGDTTISNGTLQVSDASAVSANGNLNIGPSGTLELNGFSETVNGLRGSGIIDNNSSTANATLTFGSGGFGTNIWNGTIHDQGLGFGVSLTKVGNDVLVINGTNLVHGANPGLQMNAGITIIGNNAVVDTGANEYWVQQNAGIATNMLNGGTLNMGSYFVVGRNAANANGTFIMNSGIVNKTGGGVVVIGSLGGIGTLVINGGTFLNNSDLWLGEGPSAVTAMYLNGGLIQADVIRVNNNGGNPTALQYAYFNGGTLQATANNLDYLQSASVISFNVMSNGLILDDNGYTLGISTAVLVAGDNNQGGLVKKGSGTVYLETPNQYTGLTVVTNGTLAGAGSVNGSVLVTSAGNLGAGDTNGVGTFTINNNGNLTLQGSATMRISKTGGTRKSDNVVVSGNTSYGGMLNIQNVTSDSTPLALGDTFQLFSVTGSTNGNFTSVTGIPGVGMGYAFNPTNGVLSVVVSTGPGTFTNPTRITSFALSGANVVMTGTNGQAGAAYYLLQSTNMGLALSQWKTVATNVLSTSGNYTFTGTNVVTPGGKQQFFILSNTNSNH